VHHPLFQKMSSIAGARGAEGSLSACAYSLVMISADP